MWGFWKVLAFRVKSMAWANCLKWFQGYCTVAEFLPRNLALCLGTCLYGGVMNQTSWYHLSTHSSHLFHWAYVQYRPSISWKALTVSIYHCFVLHHHLLSVACIRLYCAVHYVAMDFFWISCCSWSSDNSCDGCYHYWCSSWSQAMSQTLTNFFSYQLTIIYNY